MKSLILLFSAVLSAQAFAKTVACANADHLVLLTSDASHSAEINQGKGTDIILGERDKNCASGCLQVSGFSVLGDMYPNVIATSTNADQSSIGAIFATEGTKYSGKLFSGDAIVADMGHDDTVTIGYSSAQKRAVLTLGSQKMHMFRMIRGQLTATSAQESLDACAETQDTISLIRFHMLDSTNMFAQIWEAVATCKQTAAAASCFDQKTQDLAQLTNEQMLANDQDRRQKYGDVELIPQESNPADHLKAILSLVKEMMLKM